MINSYSLKVNGLRVIWKVKVVKLLQLYLPFQPCICMRFVFTGLALITCSTIWANSDSLSVKRKDSLSEVTVTPYLKRDKASLANYFVSVDSPEFLKFSSGMNITNALRGLYPGLNLPPYAPQAIDTDQIFVIDGMPMNGSLNNYFSLNSFDYNGISATRSGNALTILDQAAASGAFILSSKSGKDIDKPTLEFNSFNTWGFGETATYVFGGPGFPPSGTTNKVNDFNFTQSLAFSQDFGKVDTRISYNFLANHNSWNHELYDSYSDPKLHRLKINTGIDITPRLNVRLIADGSHSANQYTTTYQFGANPPNTVSNKIRNNYYQANLFANYQVLDWLRVGGQVYYGNLLNHNNSENKTTSTVDKNDSDFELLSTTLTVNFAKSLGDLGINSTIGYSTKKSNKGVNLTSGIYEASYKNEINSSSFLASILLGYKNRLFLDGTWRRTSYSLLPTDINDKDNYAVSSSFWILKNSASRVVSSWKVRASTGKSFAEFYTRSPYSWIYPADQSRPEDISKNEAGTEISFLKSRLSLSANYFTSTAEGFFTAFDPVSGGVIWTSGMKLINDGYEAIADLNLGSGKSVRYNARLIWSQYKVFVGSRSGGSGSSFYEDKPEWGGSIWNMLSWKNISALIILETKQNVTIYSFSGGGPTITESSWTKLRDVSLGYTFSIPQFRIQECYLSITGRNLLNSNSQNYDSEVYGYPNNSTVQKSVTLNLGLTF
jgi:hypothetical protein